MSCCRALISIAFRALVQQEWWVEGRFGVSPRSGHPVKFPWGRPCQPDTEVGPAQDAALVYRRAEVPVTGFRQGPRKLGNSGLEAWPFQWRGAVWTLRPKARTTGSGQQQLRCSDCPDGETNAEGPFWGHDGLQRPLSASPSSAGTNVDHQLLASRVLEKTAAIQRRSGRRKWATKQNQTHVRYAE